MSPITTTFACGIGNALQWHAIFWNQSHLKRLGSSFSKNEKYSYRGSDFVSVPQTLFHLVFPPRPISPPPPPPPPSAARLIFPPPPAPLALPLPAPPAAPAPDPEPTSRRIASSFRETESFRPCAAAAVVVEAATVVSAPHDGGVPTPGLSMSALARSSRKARNQAAAAAR